jgi:ADP-ribose pyrophosphatase YjhB (NUDIX family)
LGRVSESSGVPDARDLARWSAALAGIARTGLGFTQNLYERERFEEVLHIAADIKAASTAVDERRAEVDDADEADEADEAAVTIQRETDHFVKEWLTNVGEGVPGYVTPKVAVGAVVGNEAGEILLVQRADSGIWLYPTGWADIGYSPSEIAVKEVAEETGIECEPVSLLSVMDGQRLGFTRFGMYMLLFYCRAIGGELRPHPLECASVGWFAEDALPEATAGASLWGSMAFAAIRGEQSPTRFDQPRNPVWRP